MGSAKGGRGAAELEAEILRHQDLYYNGQPEISDAEFDALWDELKAIDPGNPALARVGRDAMDGFPKARHLMPMGSQEKAANPEEFVAWAAKVRHPEYIVQHKLDGASLELQYAGGKLVRAVTRGDGTVGDDITPNALRMKGVVRKLPEPFSGGVRGEVLMARATLAESFPEKANCRNAANGLMKRKDGVGAERLELVCYDAVGVEEAPDGDGAAPGPAEVQPFDDERGKVAWLARMGFRVAVTETFPDAYAVVDYRARVLAERASLPFDIDGLVVKGPSIDHDDMGRARPEYQIAFKFPLEEAVTVLEDVEWSESGSNYTPIGVVSPVRLAGTVVKRANLVNTNMLRGMGLRIGCRVVVVKRGEIIPKIEGLVEDLPGSRPVPVPAGCSCGAELVDEGTRLYCPNAACPKKAFHRLEKWLATLDVKEFGSAVLGKLFESGRVRDVAGLYSLEPGELAGYERMGDVLARKLLGNLAAKDAVDLATFVAGFDIEGIGVLQMEKAVKAGFDTLERARAATVEELSQVDGFGEIMARTLAEGLEAARGSMDALLATGRVRILEPSRAEGPFAGLCFCFTGELAALKRSEAAALVKSLGGTVKSTVGKGLSYLVTNDAGTGTEKNRKASSLGIPIIDEKEFLRLAGKP